MLLWFALITAGPAVLHPCPVHSGTSAAHGTVGHGDLEPTAGDHAGHIQHGTPAAQPESHSHGGGDPEQHRCACIGDCSSGTFVSGLPSGHAALVDVAAWTDRTPATRDESAIVTAPAFLRPYANGPPLGLRIA